MEIAGFRFFTIRDSAGSLIDLRFVFTVSQGPRVAMYGFDKSSSKAKQDKASDLMEKSKSLTKMREKVEKIGVEATNPHTQRVTATLEGIVPKEIGPARILIGKVEKDHFSVRLSIEQKKPEDKINLQVPFDGDPGALKGKVFDGEAFFVTDGRQDVAKLMLEIMNVGN